MSDSTTRLLVDGDILLYQVATQNEEPTRWGSGLWTLHADEETCRIQLDSRISALKKRLGCTKILIALSDPSGAYFRKEIYASYKAKRDGRKPVIYHDLREYVIRTYPTRWELGLEADDVMGLLSHPHDTVVVSEDKDLLTVPGWTYRREELVHTTRGQADLNWLGQTLMGDTTDGYPGCPGVGPKGVEKLNLGDADDPWSVVVRAFGKAKLTEEDAVTQAQLARILRPGEFKDGQPLLWDPRKGVTV